MAHRPSTIVCERSGAWAAALRRHLPRELRLRETRTLADCRHELTAAPASLLVVEVSESNLGGVLDLAADVERLFPWARLVAVAPRGGEACEWLLREAGAIHFTTSPRSAAVLARLAARHAARIPLPRATPVAEIWDSLPWQESAVS
jgi:hypothetical protein